MTLELIRLLQLSDSALPIGGFSHSAGLETYVQSGLVHDLATANEFITQMLSANLLYTDGYLVSLTYDAIAENNWGKIHEFDEWINAVKIPFEIRMASQKIGLRLIKLFEPYCQYDQLTSYLNKIRSGELSGHYCMAFGIIAFVMKIKKEEALGGFFYNAAAGMVTNCVELVPLGQQEGQGMLFSLGNKIENLVIRAINPDLDFFGLCSPGFDIRSMEHERLYSRLYMS